MSAPLLQVRGLRVEFERTAVRDASFEIAAGETVGLVGESGSGKSSLARAVLRLIPAAGGQVLWRGRDLLALRGAALRAQRRDLQIVFQDPLASLDPRMTVGDILAEPLEIFEPQLGARARGLRVERMLAAVGLEPAMARRLPHAFSGGQCQRIAIARAMMTAPALLICDEAVSSLDVSIQGQIVNLLRDMQREFGMAILFISHNLAVVRHISDRILVLYQGGIVEMAGRDALFRTPAHPYTRALLDAVPSFDREDPTAAAWTQAPPAAAEIPADAAGGCAFRSRCPHADVRCVASAPVLRAWSEGRLVACHRAEELAQEL